jgi:SAM-dependent methyltransferase
MPSRIDHCPSCGAAGLETVYEVKAIPSHSCLLMPSRSEALDFPLGDLELGFCGACGFATNRIFDPGLNKYSETYEEVQTFSPTFNRFQSELVDGLIERHDVKGKTVVEIGCGKGEFLMELCERGGNRGVGIDPSFVSGRGSYEIGDRVRFLRELYDAEKHGGLEADVIVCRHTLEHIWNTRELLQTVRASIPEGRDTLVFFELPDQERVYLDRAFWDIYYEHCSYFTKGSLERLFLDCGFDVVDSRKGFGDQYLLVDARPIAPGRRPTWVVDEDPADMAREVAAFAVDVKREIETWRERFHQLAAEGRTAAIWGAGSKGVAFLTTLGEVSALECAVDINPHKHGFFMPGTGHEVVSPEALKEVRPDVVVVMNAIYEREIREQLASMGLSPTLYAI